MNHKPPMPPAETLRILRHTIRRLENLPDTEGDLARQKDFKRVLGERIAVLEVQVARTSPE